MLMPQKRLQSDQFKKGNNAKVSVVTCATLQEIRLNLKKKLQIEHAHTNDVILRR